MKRFFISVAAFLLCLFPASAQEPDYSESIRSVEVQTDYTQISPISLSATEFNLQTLRTACTGNEDYLLALRFLQSQLCEDRDNILSAQKMLKSERALYDAQMAQYKDRKSLSTSLYKQTDAIAKSINEIIRNMDKEYEILKKMDNSSTAIQNQQARTDQLKRDLYDQLGKINQLKQRASGTGDEILHQEFERLNTFLIEMTDKDTRLGSLQSQNKANLDIVNAAIRTVEADIKAASKNK